MYQVEQWRPLSYDFFKHFSISSTGRLKNTSSGAIYKQRVQKKTGLSFCDISTTTENGDKLRKTIYITSEVARAFVPLPADADKVKYVATHKENVSKLDNLAKNICWKTYSEISKENMVKYPENRSKLAEFNKKKFKGYVKKKYIKIADREENSKDELVLTTTSTGIDLGIDYGVRLEWHPKEDITTHELALCLPYILYPNRSTFEIDENEQRFRHFKIIKKKAFN